MNTTRALITLLLAVTAAAAVGSYLLASSASWTGGAWTGLAIITAAVPLYVWLLFLLFRQQSQDTPS